MSYMHIENLYKARHILAFKECYALEKIHGTSAHISWNKEQVGFFTGESHPSFVALFDKERLVENFIALGHEKVMVYGENYGGKIQGMSETYGKEKKFVCFEVTIDGLWLNVPNAHDVVTKLGLEFVHYDLIPATKEAIEAIMAMDSAQAIRNGMGPGHRREGVVLRPVFEVRLNNDERVIAKHKNPEFAETKTPRPLDEAKLKLLEEAEAIADEWVTDMRLNHVLDAFPQPWDVTVTGDVIKAMIADIQREAAGEIVDSREARTAIGKRTAKLFKGKLRI